MVKPLHLLLFLLPICLLQAQIDAGEDITISAGLPVKIDGSYLGYTGIPITAGDDPFVGPFEIGFDFEYFGEIQTQFAVSPNGLVSFNVPAIIGVSHQEATAIPNNIFIKTIMGPYQDLFSKPIQPHSNYIYYLTVGNSPDRKLIVGWCEAPMFGCPDLNVTYQIVLYEADDRIVNHVLAKPACTYLQNKGTHGLNYDDDLGVAVQERNASAWSASNESWLFEPNGTGNYSVSSIDFNPEPIVPAGKIEWLWYKNSYPGGEILGKESSLIVHPTESTMYYIEITLCNGMKYVDDVFVKVIPVPNAFNPNSPEEVNRTFKFYTTQVSNLYQFRMYIYNRWGQLVFDTSDISLGWDGTQNGTPCNPGVYTWVVNYQGEKGKASNKGSVTLIR